MDVFSVQRGQMQRRPIQAIPAIRIGASGEQRSHAARLTLCRGDMKVRHRERALHP